MEVSGRKGSDIEDTCKFVCKPCEDRDLYTRADGFCIDCTEYMCQSCFDTHKQFRVSRDHTLTNVKESPVTKEQKEDLEKCKEHFSELIKFYCSQHEQVGCGDCMILEHKTCKVEYIRDKAITFKDSQEFRELIKGAEKVHIDAKQMLSSIKNNKVQVKDINSKFKLDVNMFKAEMMSHITKMTNAMLKQGEDIKATSLKSMDDLEKENESLMNEISSLTQLLESQTEQPQKLFVSSISLKPELHRLKGQLDNIKGRNKIDIYKFQRDINLERTVKQLGGLQKIKPRNETDEQEEERPEITAKVVQARVVPMLQPLLDRRLICRNIAVDGEYLSYADNGSGNVGLFVDKKSMRKGHYFEVEIMSMGRRGSIAIGLVPHDYSENQQPGWGYGSIGYHADDGRLYYESGSGGFLFGQKCNVGDRIGCGTTFQGIFSIAFTTVFTRNGEKIGERNIRPFIFYYPAIGMHSAGEKVKVVLDAKMPCR